MYVLNEPRGDFIVVHYEPYWSHSWNLTKGNLSKGNLTKEKSYCSHDILQAYFSNNFLLGDLIKKTLIKEK